MEQQQIQCLAAAVQQVLDRLRETKRHEKRVAGHDRASKRRRTAAALPSLHTVGYELHRAAVAIPDSAVAQLRAQAGRRSAFRDAIFNSLVINRDDRRRTQFSPQRINSLLANIESVLQRAGYLATHSASEWKAVQSLPGCGQQPAHCDHGPDNLFGLLDRQMPLFVIVALMPHTRLHVWPNSIRLITEARRAQRRAPIAPETLLLEAGDVLVCRADLVHAGAAYDEQHFRLHCFLDHSACPRLPNDTYIVHRDAHPSVQAAILQQ